MFNDFLAGYTEAMLWANTNGETTDGEFVSVDATGGMYDADLSDEDMEAELTEEATQQLEADARDFYDSNLEDLESAVKAGWPWDYLGHNFALTRNGHGTGFWDRGLGELGDRLTKASKAHGEAHLEIYEGAIHHA